MTFFLSWKTKRGQSPFILVVWETGAMKVNGDHYCAEHLLLLSY